MDENVFEAFLNQYLKEAEDLDDGGTGPPDMPEGGEADPTPDEMPDMGDVGMDDNSMGMEDDSMGGDEQFDTDGLEDLTNNQQDENMPLDDKVSAIMNNELYKRFLELLNAIKTQTTMINNNGDILYSLSDKTEEVNKNLKRLDDNINLYLKNKFVNTDYSPNLLFYNKCLNLLKALNDYFSIAIKKGLKKTE